MSENPFEGENPVLEDEPGCLFPSECCMPGEHLTSECHTAEMMEQIEEQHRAESREHVRVPGETEFEFWMCSQCRADKTLADMAGHNFIECDGCRHNREVIRILKERLGET